MSCAAVERFYRLVFANASEFRQWTGRIVEFAAGLREIVPMREELRPVIFVPLHPSASAPRYAYLSAGARGLGVHLSSGATIDETPISLADLPPGLTMLYGDPIDAAEYARQHPIHPGGEGSMDAG